MTAGEAPGAAQPAGSPDPQPEAVEPSWQRLDRRTIWVTAVVIVGVVLGPVGLPFFFGFLGSPHVPLVVGLILGGAVVGGVGAAGIDLMHWRHSSYRVTYERVEKRNQFVFHSYRSIPRDRVRSVDLTADVVHRIFGVVKVTVGTGQNTGGDTSELTLDPVSRAEGERLRALLLDRAPAASHAAQGEAAARPGAATAAPSAAGETIAAIDWQWLRYAPLTALTLGLGFAVTGGGYGLAENIGLDSTVTDLAVEVYRAAALWLLVAMIVVVLLVVGVVGSVALMIEGWWGFRLAREAGGRLLVRRGLLTSRSLTLEERRLRGVELREPIAMQLAGGATLRAVATGLNRKDAQGKKVEGASDLMPPSPRGEVDRAAAAVLSVPVSPVTTVRLRGHPRAALRRLLIRGVAGVVVLGVVLAVPGAVFSWAPDWLWVVALALLPVAVVWAVLSYRNLGHGITGEYLVVRSGGFRRDTVALQRGGVIGWKMRQSVFQRRAGLLTVTATTAAGAGAYHAPDAGVSGGLAFAEEAVPGLLTPFLERG